MTAKKKTQTVVVNQEKTLGNQIKMLEEQRALINNEKRTLKGLQEREDEIAGYLLETMREQGIDYTKGNSLSVRVSNEIVPTVKDWPKLYEHIAETMEFELLQRRPAVKACAEHWEAGDNIPGVSPTEIQKLRIRSL